MIHHADASILNKLCAILFENSQQHVLSVQRYDGAQCALRVRDLEIADDDVHCSSIRNQFRWCFGEAPAIAGLLAPRVDELAVAAGSVQFI